MGDIKDILGISRSASSGPARRRRNRSCMLNEPLSSESQKEAARSYTSAPLSPVGRR